MFRLLFDFFNKLSTGKKFRCKVDRLMSNNVDPDELAHKPARLDLRCLQKLLSAMAVKAFNKKKLYYKLRVLSQCIVLLNANENDCPSGVFSWYI